MWRWAGCVSGLSRPTNWRRTPSQQCGCPCAGPRWVSCGSPMGPLWVSCGPPVCAVYYRYYIILCVLYIYMCVLLSELWYNFSRTTSQHPAYHTSASRSG